MTQFVTRTVTRKDWVRSPGLIGYFSSNRDIWLKSLFHG